MRRRKRISRTIYRLLRGWFLKEHYNELSRRIDHKDLLHALIDDQGRTYYEFPERIGLPLERFAKQKEFFEWLGAGINYENLGTLLKSAEDFQEDAILDVKDRPKAAAKKMAKVTAIIRQLQLRREAVVQLDLMVNTLCVMIVREDEDPMEFNEEIHKEKCDYFMSHISDYGFFFRLTSSRRLFNLLNISKENYSSTLNAWRQSLEEIEPLLKIISSSTGSSEPETPTSPFK